MDKRLEELIEMINKLRDLDLPVIVEGKKDVAALEKFGIKAIPLRGGLDAFCERIGKIYKEVILLLDVDKEGKKMALTLFKNFQIIGVKANRKFMRKLSNIGISHVEGIPKFIKKRGDINGKNFSSFNEIYYPCSDRNRRGSKQT